jgi:hypothetical protein
MKHENRTASSALVKWNLGPQGIGQESDKQMQFVRSGKK